MLNFQSPIIALLTPFDAGGEIAWPAFKTYLSALYSWGVRTVLSNGSTAEFPSLTGTERQQVVEFVRQNFPGSVINNVSATCVNDVRELIAGTQGYADALMLLPPYYYAACRNEGLCDFFAQALSGTAMPALLYNFPLHTGNKIGNELIAMLLDRGIALAGIKDSSGDPDNAVAYRTGFPELKIYFAGDAEALKAMQNGLSGLLSGGANPLPELLLALQTCFTESADKALSLQRCLNVWNDYRESSGRLEIPLLKAAMGARIAGFPLHVRAPFTPVPAEEIHGIRSIILQCLNDLKTIMASP